MPLILVSAGLLSAPTTAHTRPSAPSAAGFDRNYASALAAANRFLQAWQNQDRETGLLMMSDWARQGCSGESLEAFFSSGPEAAYEISRGKKLKMGRYAFSVTLFTSPRRVSQNVKPRKSEIVIGRESEHEWTVDKLP